MNKFNSLIRKIADEQTMTTQQIKREPAKVISVSENGRKATVRLLNGSEPQLLNKTGEVLTANDDVWIEYRVNPSSAYIVMRNGEADPLYNVVYSTYSHRVGTWIDGSELYEKTYEITQLGDSSDRSVSVPLDIQMLREIVESRGQLIGQGFSHPLECMPISSDGTAAEAVDATSYSLSTTTLTVYNGSTDRSACKAYVTIRYTINNVPHTTLEWIRSTGDQYIDTDIYIDTAAHRLELDCMFSDFVVTASVEADYYVGSITDADQQPYWKRFGMYNFARRYNQLQYEFGFCAPYFQGSVIAQGSSYTSRGTASLQPNGDMGWNGDITCDTTYQARTVYPIRIFGYRGDDASSDQWLRSCILHNVKMTLYGVKIYDLNTDAVIHDLVPAKRDSDGEIGLFDEITGIFYENSGSTPFVIPT